MEAGNGSIDDDEQICYLAVEDDGCKTLDLSGINGSSSTVKFEAIIGPDVVRGHDNPLTTSATFDTGCFTTPPISVASMRRRDGGDGSFIRVVDVNATRIQLIVDEDRISDPDRGHTDEPTSVLAFSGAFTTPVTLSYVKIKQYGKKLKFAWQTSAESFHLGFHLWGETRDGWIQLNPKLIPSEGAITGALNRYHKKIRLSGEQYNEVTKFGISSVDTSGYEEFYGPFDANQEYGEAETSDPIDWADTRAQFDVSMRKKGYTYVGGRWKKLNKRKKRKLERRQASILAESLDVKLDGFGIRKITAGKILSLRPAWLGMNLGSLAITLNDDPVARRIISEDAYLSADDVVVLNAIEPQGNDGLYLNDYTYRIQKNRRKALDAQHYDGPIYIDDNLSTKVYLEKNLTQDKQYLAAITSGSPWYDAQLFTTSGAVSKQYTVSFDQPLDMELPAKLKLDLFGSIDLPAEQDDHHVIIEVNGSAVFDGRFDGLSQLKTEVELLPGVLQQTDNVIVVTLPGDTGLVADIVLVDELIVQAPTVLNQETSSDFLSLDNAQGYTVDFAEGSIARQVFAYSSKGGLTSIEKTVTESGVVFPAIPFLSSLNNESSLHYAVVDLASVPAAEMVEHINSVDSGGLSSPQAAADLMIVAHPNFIGEDLRDYIEYKRDLGLEVQLINWFDVVASSGFGNNTPQSLDNYLNSLDASVRPSHLLLVGGHTYDYKNLLGQNAVNFIPAHYRKVSIFEYTQSDNVFADLDNDNLPDLAIGRWPVRTLGDLQAIIAKSIQWQEMHQAEDVTNDVLLIAQPKDGRNLNFESSLEGRVSSHLNRKSGAANIERVYLGQMTSASPVTEARSAIEQAINRGTRLVSFAGHASQSGWGFQGIVNTALINSLTNYDAPTVVMPLACYTTDYQNLTTNTLAHQWLFAGNQGAAAVHGATSLGQYRENGIFAERLLKESAAGISLGQAIMKAKRRMASVNETLHNWALLGDPTLPAP